MLCLWMQHLFLTVADTRELLAETLLLTDATTYAILYFDKCLKNAVTTYGHN